MPRSPDPEVRRRWTRLIRSFQAGRETVAEFCERHEVSTASFYTWRRRLSGEAGPANDPPRGFQPVVVTAGAAPRVRLPSGIVIELGDDPRALELALDRLPVLSMKPIVAVPSTQASPSSKAKP